MRNGRSPRLETMKADLSSVTRDLLHPSYYIWPLEFVFRGTGPTPALHKSTTSRYKCGILDKR